jgi:hypothetical protein
VLLALGLLAATGLLTPPVSATWQSSQGAGPQTVSAGTLAPPTGTAACVLLLPTRVRVTWTATPSTFADGYEVFRSTTDGGPYASVGTVAGQATTTFTDSTATLLTTYYFVVQSTRHLWRSVDSAQAAATVPLSLCSG